LYIVVIVRWCKPIQL